MANAHEGKVRIEITGDPKSVINVDMELNLKEVGEVAADLRTCNKFERKNGSYFVHCQASLLAFVRSVITHEGCQILSEPEPYNA